ILTGLCVLPIFVTQTSAHYVQDFKSKIKTTMTSISAGKEWLEKSIESEYIRFYPYDSLTGKDCIGHGAFGVVFKATVAGSGITVAYKMIKYWDEDEFLKSFVKEVC